MKAFSSGFGQNGKENEWSGYCFLTYKWNRKYDSDAGICRDVIRVNYVHLFNGCVGRKPSNILSKSVSANVAIFSSNVATGKKDGFPEWD